MKEERKEGQDGRRMQQVIKRQNCEARKENKENRKQELKELFRQDGADPEGGERSGTLQKHEVTRGRCMESGV